MSTPQVKEVGKTPKEGRERTPASPPPPPGERSQAAVAEAMQKAEVCQLATGTTLECRCSPEKPRKPNPQGYLCIVPKATLKKEVALQLGKDWLPTSNEKEQKRAVSASWKCEPKREQLAVKVVTRGHQAGPQHVFVAMRDSDGEPAPGEYEQLSGNQKTLEVDPAPCSIRHVWPYTQPPRRTYVWVRGCGGRSGRFVVLVYPSQQVEVSIKVCKAFQSFAKGIKGYLEKLAVSRGPFTLSVKYTPPAGALKFGWGWRESSDAWYAEYVFHAAGGIKAAISLAAEAQLSLLHIAGTAGLSALGFPPPLASFCMEVIKEYLADIYVYLRFGVHLDAMAGAEIKVPSHRDPSEAGGGLKLPGNLQLAVGLAARLGGGLLYVKVSGEVLVSVVIENKAALVLGKPGSPAAIKVKSECTLPGVVAAVKIVTHAGWYDTTMERPWTVWSANLKVWKKEFKLLQFGEGQQHGGH